MSSMCFLRGDTGHCNEWISMCVADKPISPTAVGSQVFLTCTFLFLFPVFLFYVHKYHDP